MIQTYSGSCHCGEIQFEVDADLDHIRVCDCSVCRRPRALRWRISAPFLVCSPGILLGGRGADCG